MKITQGSAVIAGAVLLVCGLEAVVLRTSLFALLLLSIPVLIWTLFTTPSSLPFRAVVVCLLAALSAAAPVDVFFRKTGHVAVKLRPIAWGLPTAETGRRIDAGELVGGGCILPAHPATYSLLVSW